MLKRQLLAVAVILLCLVGFRFLAPSLTDAVREKLHPVMDTDFDFQAAFREVGSHLSRAEEQVAVWLGMEDLPALPAFAPDPADIRA